MNYKMRNKMIHLQSFHGYVLRAPSPLTLLIGNGCREYTIQYQSIGGNDIAFAINRTSDGEAPRLVKGLRWSIRGDESRKLASLIACCIADDITHGSDQLTPNLDDLTNELLGSYDFVGRKFRTLTGIRD